MDNVPRNNIDQSLSPKDKEQLISNFPLFGLLNSHDITELALLARTLSVPTDFIIVREGEMVDSFYLIYSGTAEVSKQVHTLEKKETLHIIELHSGDAIGLSETSFFSNTGIRKATVVAQSPMILLTIDIITFNKFLSRPGINYPALRNIGENILLMKILKDIPIFYSVANEPIRQLVQRLTRDSIKAGDILFNEGDSAEGCYVFLSGIINIINVNDNEKNIIAELQSPVLIGEAAFLSNVKRNATVQAQTDGEFVLITREEINKIFKKDNILLQSIILSRIEQIKPQPNSDILVKEKGNRIVLQRADKKYKVILSNQEYELWNNLDGNTPLKTIENNLSDYTLAEIYAFVLKMNNAGFLNINEIHRLPKNSKLKQLMFHLINKIKAIWK